MSHDARATRGSSLVGRGDRNRVRWAHNRKRKKKAREKRKATDRRGTRKVRS